MGGPKCPASRPGASAPLALRRTVYRRSAAHAGFTMRNAANATSVIPFRIKPIAQLRPHGHGASSAGAPAVLCFGSRRLPRMNDIAIAYCRTAGEKSYRSADTLSSRRHEVSAQPRIGLTLDPSRARPSGGWKRPSRPQTGPVRPVRSQRRPIDALSVFSDYRCRPVHIRSHALTRVPDHLRRSIPGI